MIRLYIDEDSMDRALVRALRARGVDVATALEEGMIEVRILITSTTPLLKGGYCIRVMWRTSTTFI